jgi:Transglutaminase-like superfamily
MTDGKHRIRARLLKFTKAKWLRLWRRPRAEKWLAVQSLVVCLLSVIALHLIGFGRWKRILWASSGGGNLGPTTSSHRDASTARVYASVLDMVARNTPLGLVTCLPRSLTLWWLLRRHGVESELRIGVRRESARIVAHAWVVCHGAVVGETDPGQYVSFESAATAI